VPLLKQGLKRRLNPQPAKRFVVEPKEKKSPQSVHDAAGRPAE